MCRVGGLEVQGDEWDFVVQGERMSRDGEQGGGDDEVGVCLCGDGAAEGDGGHEEVEVDVSQAAVLGDDRVEMTCEERPEQGLVEFEHYDSDYLLHGEREHVRGYTRVRWDEMGELGLEDYVNVVEISG